jgi:hypothetical protein
MTALDVFAPGRQVKAKAKEVAVLPHVRSF